MIRYKKYQVTGEDSPLKGLWYARPVIEETFDIEKLAKHCLLYTSDAADD